MAKDLKNTSIRGSLSEKEKPDRGNANEPSPAGDRPLGEQKRPQVGQQASQQDVGENRPDPDVVSEFRIVPGDPKLRDPKITIDPEFLSYIQEQSEEEHGLLEQQIEEDGECRDAILCWKNPESGLFVIVDGHNRYEIAVRRSFPYRVRLIDLPNREAVKERISIIQLGRRNLRPESCSYHRGLRYERARHQGQKVDLTSGQIVQKGDEDLATTAAELIASEHRVDEKTIRRDGDFARDLDILAENCGHLIRQKVLCGEVKISRQDIGTLAKLRPSDQRPLVQQVLAIGKLPKNPPRKPTPLESLRRAWDKTVEEERRSFLAGLLAEPEVADVVEGLLGERTEVAE